MEILIDTNIALYFLGGEKPLVNLLDNEILHVSFITQLELLAYDKITVKEQRKVKAFLKDCVIVDINHSIKTHTIDIRKQSGIKLPDAIIAATARSEFMPLLSADKEFKKVKNLQLFSYQF
ncbi:MAG TPA: type II toxin-antitoxin system VapC family toxin [Balneolaceae bacterium]